MLERRSVAYCFDGSLPGLLCCIFDSYTRKEEPAAILLEGEPCFYPLHTVETVEEHADRVWRSLLKMGGEVADWVRDAALSCAEDYADAVFDFIRMAYQQGGRITGMYGDPVVARVFKLVRAIRNESHYYKEFLRFSDYSGALVSEIEPTGLVLGAIAQHYADRLPEEHFLIFDRTHGLALFYRPYEWAVREVEELELPPADEREQTFRALWLRYYDTIGVEGRFNPKLRMNLMPKHFWKHMTEYELLLRTHNALPPAPRHKRFGAASRTALPESGV